MYAIQAEDVLAEDIVVLPTLCADTTSAMFMMIAKAELWIQSVEVPVHFFVVHEDSQHLTVVIKQDGNVVYELQAWPITNVIDSRETEMFSKKDRTLN